MNNILITGGAGFIGSSIAIQLLNKDYSVTILDNLSRQIHGNDPEKSYLYLRIKNKKNFIYGDVNNRSDWERGLTDNDTVVHFASETGTGRSMYEIKKYTNTNIDGTTIFLDLLTNNKTNIKKVVLASSRAVYGEGKHFCEDMVLYIPQREGKLI
jgi:dTDP-L-rhamnose 4-epimerase